MCYIKMFYLQMKQVKKEIIRNSRSMTMPNLYVDHQKSKLKLIKMFCVDCRGHVLNILPSENAWFAMYSMYSTNQMYVQNLHILIFQKEILFLYIHISASTVGIFYNKLNIVLLCIFGDQRKKKVTILEALTENQTSKSINSFFW